MRKIRERENVGERTLISKDITFEGKGKRGGGLAGREKLFKVEPRKKANAQEKWEAKKRRERVDELEQETRSF